MIIIAFMKELKRWYRIIKNPVLSWPRYIYYNYLCKNIILKGTGRIIPSKHVVMDLSKNCSIVLEGKQDLQLGHNQVKGSKAETLIRLEENAEWRCRNGGWIFYSTDIEVKRGALLDTGFFSMNVGSVIVVDKHITIGEDAMFGRNVIVYDSDFHSILGTDGMANNYPEDVVIGEHAWLTTNIIVLKGVKIGNGVLIAANTVVAKDVPDNSLAGASSVGKVIKENIQWSRLRCPRE